MTFRTASPLVRRLLVAASSVVLLAGFVCAQEKTPAIREGDHAFLRQFRLDSAVEGIFEDVGITTLNLRGHIPPGHTLTLSYVARGADRQVIESLSVVDRNVADLNEAIDYTVRVTRVEPPDMEEGAVGKARWVRAMTRKYGGVTETTRGSGRLPDHYGEGGHNTRAWSVEPVEKPVLGQEYVVARTAVLRQVRTPIGNGGVALEDGPSVFSYEIRYKVTRAAPNERNMLLPYKDP